MRTQAPDSKRPQGGVATPTQVNKELCQDEFAKTNKKAGHCYGIGIIAPEELYLNTSRRCLAGPRPPPVLLLPQKQGLPV